MTVKEILHATETKMKKTAEATQREFSTIRTGRASTAILESVKVDYYGTPTPVKQLAAVSTPDARLIVIQPWDKSYIEGIVAALSKTGTGASPIVDKDLIRINLPSLTEEYRKEILRILSEKIEEARITVRRWREKGWEEIQQGFRDGKIREDDKFRGKDELQKLVDEYNGKIEEIGERKRKEIES